MIRQIIWSTYEARPSESKYSRFRCLPYIKQSCSSNIDHTHLYLPFLSALPYRRQVLCHASKRCDIEFFQDMVFSLPLRSARTNVPSFLCISGRGPTATPSAVIQPKYCQNQSWTKQSTKSSGSIEDLMLVSAGFPHNYVVRGSAYISSFIFLYKLIFSW